MTIAVDFHCGEDCTALIWSTRRLFVDGSVGGVAVLVLGALSQADGRKPAFAAASKSVRS